MSQEIDEKVYVAGWQKLIHGAQIFHSCGDIIKIDLASEEGDIEVFLDSSVISRLLEHAFEHIPAKTPYHQKCLDSIWTILSKFPKIPIIIRPVINKKGLKIRNAYKI